MLCNICKKNPAVIFSSKEENGTRKMEGLCVSCAKNQGINTDEILKAQSDAQAKNLNNGLEELFGHLAESLNNIDGIEFDAMAFPDMGNMNFTNNSNDDEEDDDDEEQNSKRPPIFAGAIPLGSIFGNLNNFKQNNGQDEVANSGSNVKKKVKPEKKKSANKRKKYLDTFGTNLTVKAKNGELDMVVGRDRELQRVIQILNRRTKNNPCLIGEPGVGKTAIAQGLAIKIANQKVPVKLLNKEVYLLDMTAVLAGTQFRGQFESRMKGIIEECIHFGNIILVIDEVHSIIGAGAGGENDSMNAANILKPALANGQIQLIGTTTIKEYRKYIEKDTALERRFQQVMIDEPSSDDAIDILKGIKKYYEDYHKVKISNEVIKQTVLMSEK